MSYYGGNGICANPNPPLPRPKLEIPEFGAAPPPPPAMPWRELYSSGGAYGQSPREIHRFPASPQSAADNSLPGSVQEQQGMRVQKSLNLKDNDGGKDFVRHETEDVNCSKDCGHGRNWKEKKLEFLFGDHVLVRCNQCKWLAGQVRRNKSDGVQVWVEVAQTLVNVPLELLTTHLMKLQSCQLSFPTTESVSSSSSSLASGTSQGTTNTISYLAQFQCVRPSHLSHRKLFQHVHILPTAQLSAPTPPRLFVEGEHQSVQKTHSHLLRKPPAAQGCEPVCRGSSYIPRPSAPAAAVGRLCPNEEDNYAPVCKATAGEDVPDSGNSSVDGDDANLSVSWDENISEEEREKKNDEIRAALFAKYLTFLSTASGPTDSSVPSMVPHKGVSPTKNTPPAAVTSAGHQLSSLRIEPNCAENHLNCRPPPSPLSVDTLLPDANGGLVTKTFPRLPPHGGSLALPPNAKGGLLSETFPTLPAHGEPLQKMDKISHGIHYGSVLQGPGGTNLPLNSCHPSTTKKWQGFRGSPTSEKPPHRTNHTTPKV